MMDQRAFRRNRCSRSATQGIPRRLPSSYRDSSLASALNPREERNDGGACRALLSRCHPSLHFEPSAPLAILTLAITCRPDWLRQGRGAQ
ncbi:hypothetical protein MRX96_041873 [Rhipicephalus microplus]